MGCTIQNPTIEGSPVFPPFGQVEFKSLVKALTIEELLQDTKLVERLTRDEKKRKKALEEPEVIIVPAAPIEVLQKQIEAKVAMSAFEIYRKFLDLVAANGSQWSPRLSWGKLKREPYSGPRQKTKSPLSRWLEKFPKEEELNVS